ncbi:unnamed protein product [Heligmosomoides polygyrus]|uniref:NAD(P)H-hydrate epimerase n=1 Tax=Heligmosomoides polygyrus TaxID=6339 RepID=A0A183FEC8_HELPZ|nr:unnamed protein product [Heligmosomoides polygyrus]
MKQDEAAKIDEELFSKYGFKVEQLMELAGLACAKAIFAQYSKGKVLVLCGPGNNGGDGFVCARHLQQFSMTVRRFVTAVAVPCPHWKRWVSSVLAKSFRRVTKTDQTLSTVSGIQVLPTLPALSGFSLIVDAFFGFSFKPPVREPFGEIIEAVTKSGTFVFSIDIPSG